MIDATIPQGVLLEIPYPKARNSELVTCLRHEGERCPRCNGSGYRPRKHCAGCSEPAGWPSRGGKALLGMRNRRDPNQPLYCLTCHPELGGGLAMLDGMRY